MLTSYIFGVFVMFYMISTYILVRVRLLPILQYPGSFTNLQFCLIRSKVKLIYHTYVHNSIKHQDLYLGPQSIQSSIDMWSTGCVLAELLLGQVCVIDFFSLIIVTSILYCINLPRNDVNVFLIICHPCVI